MLVYIYLLKNIIKKYFRFATKVENFWWKNYRRNFDLKKYQNIKKYVGNIRPAQYSGRNFWLQQKQYFSKDIRLIDISHGYLVNRSGGTKFLVPALFGMKNGVFCLAKPKPKFVMNFWAKFKCYLSWLLREISSCCWRNCPIQQVKPVEIGI